MYGVVTRNAEELAWPAFEKGFYEVKDVTGRRTEPVGDGVNMISCFGDSRTVDQSPELAARTADGRLATRERRYFDWGTVCPSREEYRSDLLELVDDCVRTAPDLRLDDVGFPRAEYCHCEVCQEAFASSGIEDWLEWRADVVTGFVAEAADRVPGRTYLTLYPDPYPGHLIERSGVDVESLATHVDEFVVPLYDMAYSTTYWVEALASGFLDRLPAPLTIELYAVEVEIDALVRAAEVAGACAETVLFAYEAETGRAVIDRLVGE
jgi:hypothetical protein